MHRLLSSLLLMTLGLAGCSSEDTTSHATGTSTGTSHGGAGGGGTGVGAGGGHGGDSSSTGTGGTDPAIPEWASAIPLQNLGRAAQHRVHGLGQRQHPQAGLQRH